MTSAELIDHPQALILMEQQRAIDELRAKVQNRAAELQLARSDLDQHDAVAKLTEKRAKDVAPEDALDHILRLEAVIKLERRRNDVLLAKENQIQEQVLTQRRKDLLTLRQQADALYRATGWNPEADNSNKPSRSVLQEQVHEMAELEQTLVRNQRAAQVILHKKENTIQMLEAELQKAKEKQETLHELYNQIRVKDRDAQELRNMLQHMASEDEKRSQALVVGGQMRDEYAFQCVQGDIEMLKTAVQQTRARKARLDKLNKEQQARTTVLKARLAVVSAAMHDLGIDPAKLPRAPPTAASMSGVLVPALDAPLSAPTTGGTSGPATATRTEGADGQADQPHESLINAASAQANPVEEHVAPEFFDLLQRDLEEMRGMLARKNIITFEKQLVVESMRESVQALSSEVEAQEAQRKQRKAEQEQEVMSLEAQLRLKNDAARAAIDDLLSTNQVLRRDVRERAVPRRTNIAPVDASKNKMKF